MKTVNVGELKTNFSKILGDVQKGAKITIAFGKKKEKLAVIVPYKNYMKKERKIGLLEQKAAYKIKKNFKFTDEEFLAS